MLATWLECICCKDFYANSVFIAKFYVSSCSMEFVILQWGKS